MIAIDIAILPPDPVKSLAIELSEKLSPDFHLNETDILPHITLGLGFVDLGKGQGKEAGMVSGLGKGSKTEKPTDLTAKPNWPLNLNLTSNIKPFEVVVDRVEGRYLMCRKSEQLYRLHKGICDGMKFVHVNANQGTTLPEGSARSHLNLLQGSSLNSAYVGEVDDKTIDYTSNFKWRNAYGNWVPHITLGWDDKLVVSEKWLAGSQFPVKFTVDRVYICQLGIKNTCRKILEGISFSQG